MLEAPEVEEDGPSLCKFYLQPMSAILAWVSRQMPIPPSRSQIRLAPCDRSMVMRFFASSPAFKGILDARNQRGVIVRAINMVAGLCMCAIFGATASVAQTPSSSDFLLPPKTYYRTATVQ